MQTLALVMPRALESSLGSIFDQHLAGAGLQVHRSALISTTDLSNYTVSILVYNQHGNMTPIDFHRLCAAAV